MIALRNFPSVFFLLSLSCHFLMISCAESKTAQCQKIMGVTREIADKSAESRQTKDVAQNLKMAENFAESAKIMKNLSISDAQLAKYQQGYGEVYQSYADITRKFIDALQNKDIVMARRMQKQVQEIGDGEQTLRAALNNYCQAN
jgi:DNA polymerase I-like protein with 3'-5' exonuclease and polymerase domains